MAPPQLTRRAFVARSGAVAAALALASCGGTDAPLPTRRGKLLSLGGATYREDDRFPARAARNSYLFEAWDPVRERHFPVVRDYVRASRTSHVKLWLDPTSWPDVAPRSREELWALLESYDLDQPGSRPLIQRLDRQIKALNDDGVTAIVALYQRYPLSSSRATRSAHRVEQRGHAEDEAFPDDAVTASPWGWFVEHLISRWTRGGGGNARGAWVGALEIVNEPNQWLWPQSRGPALVAQMLRTADGLGAAHGWQETGQRVLGPGLSDIPIGPGDRAHTFFADFAEELLGEHLSGWRPRAPVGWSHHSYHDVETRSATTIEQARRLLVRHGWPDETVWCTEAADPYPLREDGPSRRTAQARAIRDTWAAYARFPLFAQHVVLDDEGADPCYGLRRARPVAGRGWALDAPLPAWTAWAGLA